MRLISQPETYGFSDFMRWILWIRLGDSARELDSMAFRRKADNTSFSSHDLGQRCSRRYFISARVVFSSGEKPDRQNGEGKSLIGLPGVMLPEFSSARSTNRPAPEGFPTHHRFLSRPSKSGDWLGIIALKKDVPFITSGAHGCSTAQMRSQILLAAASPRTESLSR